MKTVKLPAIFSGVKSRKDRSYRLEFDTRELAGEDAAILLNMQMDEGWLLFSPTSTVDQKDIPAGSADSGAGGKTPSQRLRAVIFILWKQSGGQGDFEDYYRHKLEMVIDQFKERIED